MVTDSSTAYFLAMFLVFLFALSVSIGLFYKDGVKPLSDNFDLGYINEPKLKPIESPSPTPEVKNTFQHNEVEDLKRKIEILKLKKELEELQKPSFDSALFNDCVDALVALGSPARKAKAEVQNTFEKNPNTQTVQEFITEYGRR